MNTAVTANLAKVFGLRVGNPLDEKLAKAISNPDSKWTAPFVYSRGNCVVRVSGMHVSSVGSAGEVRGWIQDVAERLPEFPHIAAKAKQF